MPLPLPNQDGLDSIDTSTDEDTDACDLVFGNSKDLVSGCFCKTSVSGNLENTNKVIFAVALPIKTQASVKFTFF